MDEFLNWIWWIKMLKKYNNIWNKVSNSTKEELDCQTVYYKRFLKTKIRFWSNNLRIFMLEKYLKQAQAN